MNKIIIFLVVIAVLLGAGWILLTKALLTQEVVDFIPQEEEKEDLYKSVMVVLEEKNNSGINGAAALGQTEEGLWVIISLNGAAEGVEQPAHIHFNHCDDTGEVQHHLESLVDGYSETLLEGVTLQEIMASLPLSINVHKSVEEAKEYIACGNIINPQKQE